MRTRKVVCSIGIFLTAVVGLSSTKQAFGATTTPLNIVYNGHLLDSSGNPLATSHSVRFSYWRSNDYLAGDVTATGAIHEAASNYVGWYEEHTVTPDSQGYFTVELGTNTPIPGIETMTQSDLLSLYLQVEVKAAANPDTAYEVMDIDAADATNDRSSVLSVPFSLNADFIDQREIGTGSGDIAILQADSAFAPSVIPGGTNSGTFVIDFDNTEASDVILQFGNAVSRALSFDIAGDFFRFNNDVRIEGNLTVTGLVNGFDITSLMDESRLRVMSGGGLNVNVSSGSYRVNGTVSNQEYITGLAMTDNTTNYVFFTGTGLIVNTSGFPTNVSFIPLAEVTTSAGGIAAVTDRRVLMSDDREYDIQHVFKPMYDGVAYQGDGTANVGQLYVDHDATNRRNFYRWTSTLPTLQDYDVVVRASLPPDFRYWNDPSLQITYRSSTANTADAQLDVQVFDTSGTAVTLSGSSLDLASTTWATTNLEFTGTPTWSAGQEFIILLKLHARNDEQMHLGDLRLNFHELKP